MGFSRGWRNLDQERSGPTQLRHTGGLAAAHPGPCYRGDSEESRVLSSTFSKQTAPLCGLPSPARTPGPRFGGAGGGGGGEPGTRVPLGAHKAAAPQHAAPSPAPRQLESISLGACLLPSPRSGVPDLATRIRQRAGRSKSHGCCSRTPQPRPGLCPAPHAPALPCSAVCAQAVPVRRTRPSPRGSSPGTAPYGARGSGRALPARVLAGRRSRLPRRLLLPRARREGLGGKLPATPTPGAGAPAAAASPPARRPVRAPAKRGCLRGRL